MSIGALLIGLVARACAHRGVVGHGQVVVLMQECYGVDWREGKVGLRCQGRGVVAAREGCEGGNVATGGGPLWRARWPRER